MNTDKVVEHIAGWLRRYCEETGQKGFVIGVSGGIDSAVTSALCARTGLPTICVEMPIHQAKSHVDRALEHVRADRLFSGEVERVGVLVSVSAQPDGSPLWLSRRSVPEALLSLAAAFDRETMPALRGIVPAKAPAKAN